MKKQIIFPLAAIWAGMSLIHCNAELKTTEDAKKPNVILILTDDQGDGDLQCHGSPYVKTPNLDKLYKQSVRFTDFHVDPCCSPTRSALLTGCYSSRAGVWHTIGGRSLLKEGMPTLADIFKANGYQTAVFGKWHLGENYPFRPQDRGFEESVVFGGGAIGSNADYWDNDYFNGTYKHNGEYQKYEGYCNTVWFEQAINYIRKHKDKPFFCYIPTNVPHAPLKVEDKYVEPYKSLVSDRLAHYYGMVSKMDEDLGNFLQQLRDLGLDKNTILIFMTDNGPCPWFGGIIIDFKTGFVKEGYSMGMRGGKIWGYENSQRVPFFIRWPGGNLGSDKNINALAAQIDIMPTLIDLCKLNAPDSLRIDGRSLAPLLMNKITDWPDDRTIITHNQRVEYPVKGKEYQVMTKEWRLVKRDKDELYDIQQDPCQRNDVAAQHPETVKELYHRYLNWWDHVSVDFDKYSAIYIGTGHENPVILYPHDSHPRQGKAIWVIKVARDGRYQLRMNRWPDESGKRIVENYQGDQVQQIESVSLTVGNIDLKKTVDKEVTSIPFTFDLKAGLTCFETSFNFVGTGKSVGGGYLYVSYLGPADKEKLADYVPSVPDTILKENFHQKVEPFD